jgi:quinol monooxygenase YgiN
MYVDEAAYRRHQETEHFARYARGTLGEHVTGRDVERYESIAGTPVRNA